MTVPQEVRDEIGLERGDVVSFAIVSEDSVLVKKERLCDNCVTETNHTDMMKLLVQAMKFARPGESVQEAFEHLTGLTPPQRFELCKRLCWQSSHNFRRIIADWAEKIHEK